ncbi:hypothetical protein [Hyphomicrobium sp.]|uniref:hypothetical protein n=1 Tax=Hyphomicrobium sp. TaxID=82 RepID=UPI0025BE6712|nr:hypothetical protein [Hyphomicrobium sp.]MCC7253520.1 hypothetical protein [Hyphomicrobium sp.]
MRKVCVASVAVLTLSACAGRVPQPAPLVLVSDRQLDCTAIEAETRVNNQRISDLAIEQSWKVGQNVAAGIVGFMVWPAWLGLDFQNAAGKEAEALSQRNMYLLALAKDRCGPPTQTARAATDPQPLLSPLASNAEILSTLSLASH